MLERSSSQDVNFTRPHVKPIQINARFPLIQINGYSDLISTTPPSASKMPPLPSPGGAEGLEAIAKQCLGAMADMEAALKSRERDKFTQVHYTIPWHLSSCNECL